MLKKSFFLVSLLLSMPAHAISPWLPAPGTGYVTGSLSDQYFKEFYRGNTIASLADYINITTLWLNVDYGLNEKWAMDFQSGFVYSRYAPATRGNFSGINDTSIGLRYLAVDEFKTERPFPTITLRVGGTIKGSYQLSSAGNPHSPGDKASGADASVIIGKQLSDFTNVYTQIGYRLRSNPVPNDFFIDGGIQQVINSTVSTHLAIYHTRGLSGSDIGGSGFTATPLGFQGLKEVSTLAELGLSLAIADHSSLSFSFLRLITGRNTDRSQIFSIALTQEVG